MFSRTTWKSIDWAPTRNTINIPSRLSFVGAPGPNYLLRDLRFDDQMQMQRYTKAVENKKWMQETVLGVIGNYSKRSSISLKIMSNATRGAASGVSSTRLFQEHDFGAYPNDGFSSSGACWLNLLAVLDPLDFEGSACSVFRYFLLWHLVCFGLHFERD